MIWLPWQRSFTNWKKSTDPSSTHKALSYGEKIAKICPVDTEIFDKIRQFFGGVVPDVYK